MLDVERFLYNDDYINWLEFQSKFYKLVLDKL